MEMTVDQWKKSSTISAHTRNYLGENEWKIKTFVDGFVGIDWGGRTPDTQNVAVQSRRIS